MRLDSWKAIAQYLKRDVATVRRWEKMGLPVRRVPGGRGSSVFAYTSEIDQWLAEGGTKRVATMPDAAEAPSAPSAQTAPLRHWLQPLRWFAVVVPIVAVLGWWARTSYATIDDLRIELTPDAVIAVNRANVEQWRHTFPRDRKTLLSPVGGQPRMVFGHPPSIFAATSYSLVGAGETSESGALMQFDLRGNLQRTFSFDDTFQFDSKPFAAPWALTTFAIDDSSGARRIAVAAHHYIWDPGVVTVLDDQFRRRGTFVHAGWVEGLRWLGPTRLLIGGYSNQETGGMIALLDPNALDGQGPAVQGTRHFCDNCGPNRPVTMVVMPRSEVNLASGSRFNRVVLDSMNDHVLARTMEVAAAPDEPADAIYEFDPALQIVSARFSERYWTVHRQLEAAGKLSHTREQCPDRDGPRSIRVWTPATGWQSKSITKGAS